MKLISLQVSNSLTHESRPTGGQSYSLLSYDRTYFSTNVRTRLTTGHILFAVFLRTIFKEVIKEPFEDSQSNKCDWVCVSMHVPVNALNVCV